MKKRLEWLCVAGAMALVLWFFHWIVKNNNGFEDWGDLDYYKLLVRGWQKGHLYLDKEPSPELLALKDPYDPEQNVNCKLGDATLYRGKYYIYFGATPALTLMLPYTLITGREMVTGGATFVFCSLALLTASGLWLAIRRRYFPDSHWLMAPLGVLALGYGTQLLALAQRPMMWELPISTGIAFTMLAVAACYRAIHGRRPVAAMAAAGLCAGLAVGARPTCLFATGLLLVPLWLAWRERLAERVWWRMGIAALVPLVACGLALMAHNYARFDNPLEWGQNYQLSGAYEGKLVHFSPRFLLHNLAVYFFQPLLWTSEFPFALAQGIEISHIPGYFGTEEVCGMAVTFPFVWFVLALPLAWWRREAGEGRRLAFAVGTLAAYALPVGGLVMCYFSTTMRYQTDYAVALAVLALIGMLAAERWLGTVTRRLQGIVVGLALLTCLVTFVVGVFVTLDYHGRSTRLFATEQWVELARRSHAALSEVGRWVGKVAGPRELKVRFKAQPVGTVETFWRATDPRLDERIVVGHIAEQLIRFGYARGAEVTAWGRPLRWDANHTHTVSVQLPSLYDPAGPGWWSGARRNLEFRERTGVAVWFSGGRALETTREPIAGSFRPGGVLGADFSGEVRRESSRVFREDELLLGLAEPHAPRGGVLRMRVILSDKLPPEGEPIFAVGAHFRSNILFVEPAPGGVKFTYETYTVPRVSSPVIKVNPRGHQIEFEMASFQADPGGRDWTGDVVLRVDGVEVMRTRQTGYGFSWGEERIGSNPFGTTCSLYFRGWIADARWGPPEAR